MHQGNETVSTKVLALTSWVIWVFDLALAWSCGSSVFLHARDCHTSSPEVKEIWSHRLNGL